MKANDKKTIREKTIADLRKQLVSLKKEYGVAMIHKAVGKLKNVRSLSTMRDTQAFVLTVIKEKEKAQA